MRHGFTSGPTGEHRQRRWGGYYFRDINYKNSFIVRLDNKELNEDMLKYNGANFTMDFDEAEDLKYLL